jgi:hypothetical protein
MDEQAGVSFSGDEVVGVGEVFKDGRDVNLHNGGWGLACKGQYIVSREGGGALVATEEGDGRVYDAHMLSDVCPDLFKEGDGVPAKGFGKGNAHMTGFASDDPGGHNSRFWAH